MAKPGILWSEAQGVLKSRIKYNGWALCIGAGMSRPAFPTWATLVERLIGKDSRVADGKTLADGLLAQYNADALVQAAQECLGLGDGEFRELLTECLYRDILDKVGASRWPQFAGFLSTRHAGGRTPASCRSYLRTLDACFPALSCADVAYLIADLIVTHSPLAPDAILSFNAEPLFYSLIVAHMTVECAREIRPDLPKSPARLIGQSVRATSGIPKGQVPYYFCHGLLPVPGGSGAASREAGVDKLVFSESEYLVLANSSFSWQSSVFLHNATTRSIVFVGLSLADSNIRRWLAWVHHLRLRELRTLRGATGSSTAHLWVTKKPRDTSQQRWTEASVAHLGVRIVWLDDWGELGDAFECMLDIRHTDNAKSVREVLRERTPDAKQG